MKDIFLLTVKILCIRLYNFVGSKFRDKITGILIISRRLLGWYISGSCIKSKKTEQNIAHRTFVLVYSVNKSLSTKITLSDILFPLL